MAFARQLRLYSDVTGLSLRIAIGGWEWPDREINP